MAWRGASSTEDAQGTPDLISSIKYLFFLSLTLSLPLSLSLSLTHTHTLSLSLSHTHSRYLIHTHTLSLTRSVGWADGPGCNLQEGEDFPRALRTVLSSSNPYPPPISNPNTPPFPTLPPPPIPKAGPEITLEAAGRRESSLLTTHWSESTLSS